MKIHGAALLTVIGTSWQVGVWGFSTASSNRIANPPSRVIRVDHVAPRTFHSALNMVPPPLPSINIQTAPPEQVDALVRSEYEVWLQKFGKTPSESKYLVFKKNYLLQLQYDQQTGVYCGLNEFGDLTPEEYEAMTAKPAQAPVPAEIVTADDVDVKIRSEYQSWGKEYGKELSEARYAIFKQNFLANMKYYEQTGKYYVLNEYADMMPEEFETVKQAVESGSTAPDSSANYMDSLSGGNAASKGSSFMPTKYRETSGSGMPSYVDSMNTSNQFGAPSMSQAPVSTTTSSGSELPSYTDSLSGGPAKVKEASFMPKKYKDTSGSGMPSYFDSMGKAPAAAAPEYTTPAPVQPLTPAGPVATGGAGASNSGAGLPSYADMLSGGKGSTMKQSSFMPKSYKQSSGSGMPSYFDNMGKASSSSTPYVPTSVPNSSPSTGAGMPSYTNALSGGDSGKMKQSSFMPKSYKASTGSGMPSYFDNMNKASSPSDISVPPPVSNTPPLAGAGMPSYTNALSGGSSGKMKESSYMPKSYKQSTGSGMPSYFDSLGNAPTSSSAPTASTGASYVAPTPSSSSSSTTTTTGGGMPSYTASLSGGSSGKMKESKYMPKSYKDTSGSGMPSYFGSLNGSPAPSGSGAGLPSYTDSLSGGSGGGRMKESSYMPKSYKQPSGAGMPSYLDNMGSAWSAPKVDTKVPTPDIRPNIAYPTPSPSSAGPLARPNLSPQPGMKADQAAQLARIASPPRGPSAGHPLANPMTRPTPLRCDQTMIMREGESFLPHAQDPVIKRGNLEPDQSSAMRYFFTGRLCATEPFRPIPMKSRFPSDQERADNQTRRSLMYFQQATRNVRRNPPEN